MDYFYASDRGLARQNDEDSIHILRASFSRSGASHERTLFLLADGMGGPNAGEIASALAVKSVSEKIAPYLASSCEAQWHEILCGAFQDANREIALHSAGNRNLSGMGTTMVSAILSGYDLFISNVGDSRLYVLDAAEGEFRQITKDHSVAQELIDSGRLAAEEGKRHPQKGLLTRALGTHPTTYPDNYRVELEPGNYVLLCCDGLSDVLSDEEIRETIINAADLKNACCALIDAANNVGGPDNISVILIRV
jgi:PPM family protein phosphatase